MEDFGYRSAMKKYARFSGRAPRKEYWMFVLIYTIGIVLLSFLDGALFGYTTESAVTGVGGSVELETPLFSGIFALAHFLPGLGAAVRRMHDIGRSGWWILVFFIPLIGVFILLYWLVKSSESDENLYGPHPYGAVDPDLFGRAGAAG